MQMKIDYIENGDIWKIKTPGICEVYREITRDCYDELRNLSYGELSDLIESELSDADKWGYGFYGHRLCERDGKCYLGIKSGISCD